MSYVNDVQLNYFAQSFWTKCKASFDAIGSAATAETNAKTYADGLNTAMDARMTAAEGAITVLNGNASTVGSVAYQIAQIVAGADASFDTLKEIADWIINDTVGATQMANDIATLKDTVFGTTSTSILKTADTSATVDTSYVFNAEDKFMVDGVEQTFADETDYNNAVANATEVTVTKKVSEGLVDKLNAESDALAKLEAYVGEIPADATATDVVSYIQEYCDKALTDSDLSQYAKASDLEALEQVVGTPSVDDGAGNVTPATGMMADLEAVEAKAQANEDAIAVLNGSDTEAGSVAKAVKDVKDAVDADVAALDGRVSANETAIGVETDAVNGVVATGIYARLEALEVPITNGDIDNIINGLV